MFKSIPSVVLFAYFFLSVTSFFSPAWADNTNDPNDTGIALAKPEADGNTGITDHDLIGLIDGKLTNNFGSLTMVYAGCYADAFTAAANDAPNLKNGKVAVLAATGKEGACKTPGTDLGNPFTSGVIKGFSGGNPVTEAVTEATRQVNRLEEDTHTKDKKTNENLELTKPTATYFGGGDKITLDPDSAKAQHAIIFIGKPNDFADWNDAAAQFQALVTAGWDPKNITIFFGDGPTAQGVPLLPGGATVADNATSKGKAAEFSYTNQDGVKVGLPVCKAATYDNLKEKLTQWAAFANLKENKPIQFYILFGGHSTRAGIKNRTISQLIRPSNSSTPASIPVSAPSAPSETAISTTPLATPSPDLNEVHREVQPEPSSDSALATRRDELLDEAKGVSRSADNPPSQPATLDTDKAAKVDNPPPAVNRDTLLENAKTEVRSNRETLLENAKTEVRANRDAVLGNAKTDLQHKPEALHEVHPGSTTSRGHEVQQEMRPASRRETREPSREEFARRTETPAFNKPAMPSSPFATPIRPGSAAEAPCTKISNIESGSIWGSTGG
jgi:hypothetical protein